MKALLLCALFVLSLFLAGCEEFERREHRERIQLADETQQIEVTVAQ